MAITSFRGKHGFLSNFYRCAVEFDGVFYSSAEHAYVAAKSLDHGVRMKVRRILHPGDVKRYGRKIAIRDGWDDIKFSVMRAIVTDKFMNNPALREKLIATGDEHIEEGNWWGDTYWGVCEGEGKNNLGKIIMHVREEINRLHPNEDVI